MVRIKVTTMYEDNNSLACGLKAEVQQKETRKISKRCMLLSVRARESSESEQIAVNLCNAHVHTRAHTNTRVRTFDMQPPRR